MKPTTVTLAVLLLLLTAAFSAAQDAGRINAALGEASKFYSAGDYRKAAAKFEEVLKLDANRASTHYNAAVCYEAAGDKKNAAAHFRSYLRLNPAAPDKKEVEGFIAALEAKPVGAKGAPAAPAAAPESAWLLKAGMFFCGDDCTGDSDFDVDPGWLAGVEYWDPLKKRNAAVYGVFYSVSGYDFSTTVAGVTVQASGDMTYLQLSAAYLWGAGGAAAQRGLPAGLYYGLGLGYGIVDVDAEGGDSSEDSMDFNAIFGYNFGNSLTAEGIWITDESAASFSLGYRF